MYPGPIRNQAFDILFGEVYLPLFLNGKINPSYFPLEINGRFERIYLDKKYPLPEDRGLGSDISSAT